MQAAESRYREVRFLAGAAALAGRALVARCVAVLVACLLTALAGCSFADRAARFRTRSTGPQSGNDDRCHHFLGGERHANGLVGQQPVDRLTGSVQRGDGIASLPQMLCGLPLRVSRRCPTAGPALRPCGGRWRRSAPAPGGSGSPSRRPGRGDPGGVEVLGLVGATPGRVTAWHGLAAISLSHRPVEPGPQRGVNLANG